MIGCVQKILPLEPLNSYSPVVQWAKLGLMLILRFIIGLQSQIIDFKNAFSWEDIPSGGVVFVDIPRYFKSDVGQCGIVSRLKKSIYGQYEAACLWYENFINRLLYFSFMVIKVDPCMFLYKTVVFVVCVYGCLFWENLQSDIDSVIKSFKDDGPGYNW